MLHGGQSGMHPLKQCNNGPVIAVSGGACDVLSVFRQFACEISFVKITENYNERVRVRCSVCVIWSANSSKRRAHTRVRRNVYTHQNKRGKLPR